MKMNSIEQRLKHLYGNIPLLIKDKVLLGFSLIDYDNKYVELEDALSHMKERPPANVVELKAIFKQYITFLELGVEKLTKYYQYFKEKREYSFCPNHA